MRISRQSILAMLFTGILVMAGSEANAAPLYETVRDLITGNLGFLIGLLLAVWGIWTWVVKQETMAGILMIVGGVLITISPGVMNFMSSLVNPVTGLGASSLTEVQGADESNDLLGIGSGGRR